MNPDRSSELVEHFVRPRNVGALDDRDRPVGTATVTVSHCGDVMRLQIEADPRGKITTAVFKTFGCPAAIAAGSVTTEWLRGRNIREAENFSGDYVTSRLSLKADKRHGSELAEAAVHEAVANWKERNCRQEVPAGEPD